MTKPFLIFCALTTILFAHKPDCDFSILKRLAEEGNSSNGVLLAIEYLQRTKPREEIDQPAAIRFIGENGTLEDAGTLQSLTGRYGFGTDHVIRRAIDQIRILNGQDPIYFSKNTSESPFLKTFGLDGYNTLNSDVFAQKLKQNEKFLTPEDLAYFTERLPFRGYVATILKETKTPFILPLKQKEFFLSSLRAKLMMKDGLSHLETLKDTRQLSYLLKDLVRPSDVEFLAKFGEAQDIKTLQRIKYLFEFCKNENEMTDRDVETSRAIDAIKERNLYKEMPRLIEESKRSILAQLAYHKRNGQGEFSDTTPLYLIDRFGTKNEIPLLEKIIKTYPANSETVIMAKKVLAKLNPNKTYNNSKNISKLTNPTLLEPKEFARELLEIEPYLTSEEVNILADKLNWHNRLMLSSYTLKTLPPYTQPQVEEILLNVRRYFDPRFVNDLPSRPELASYIKFLSEYGNKKDLESLKAASEKIVEKKPYLGPILKEAISKL